MDTRHKCYIFVHSKNREKKIVVSAQGHMSMKTFIGRSLHLPRVKHKSPDFTFQFPF